MKVIIKDDNGNVVVEKEVQDILDGQNKEMESQLKVIKKEMKTVETDISTLEGSLPFIFPPPTGAND